MSKYREHMSCFQNSTKIEKDLVSRENTKVRLFRLFLFVYFTLKYIRHDEKIEFGSIDDIYILCHEGSY